MMSWRNRPGWTGAIEPEIDKGAATIAQAIATSPRFIDAIKRGLASKPKPGVMGPSHAQVIRNAIKEAVTAE
jgi:hypothetical protein